MFLSRRTCLAMGLALGLSACFGKATPFTVVQEFYAAVQKGNVDQVLPLMALSKVSSDEMQMVAAKVQMMVAHANNQANANGGIDKVELVKEEIAEDGLRATVETRVLFKNGKDRQESFKLVKEDDKWKIKL